MYDFLCAENKNNSNAAKEAHDNASAKALEKRVNVTSTNAGTNATNKINKVQPTPHVEEKNKKAVEKLDLLVYGKDNETPKQQQREIEADTPKQQLREAKADSGNVTKTTGLLNAHRNASAWLAKTNEERKPQEVDSGHSAAEGNKITSNKPSSVGRILRPKAKPSILSNNVTTRIYMSPTKGLMTGHLTNPLKNLYNRQQKKKRSSLTLDRNFTVATFKNLEPKDDNHLPVMVGVNAMTTKPAFRRIDTLTKREDPAHNNREVIIPLREPKGKVQEAKNIDDKVGNSRMKPLKTKLARDRDRRSPINSRLQDIVDAAYKRPCDDKCSDTSDSDVETITLPVIK